MSKGRTRLKRVIESYFFSHDSNETMNEIVPRSNAVIPIDTINYAVTFIRIRSQGHAPNHCDIGSATGFFFRNGSRRYLVTNRHVIVHEDSNFYPDNILIRVHASRDSNVPNRDISIPLYGPDHQRRWLEHGNHNIDVVAIPINAYIQPEDNIEYFCPDDLPPSNLIIGVQENCMVIGYPRGFYDDTHNLPVYRLATIASAYGVSFRGNRYFLVDATLLEGTSGSPVILPSGLATRTIDITTGTVTTTIGAHAPNRLLGINSGGYIELEGLNRVWYANLITEIISYDDSDNAGEQPAPPS